MERQREAYIKASLNGITAIEQRFLQNSSGKSCQEIQKDYKSNCRAAMTMSKIREFYDSNFFTTYNNKIVTELRLKELKKIMETLFKFKNILLIKDDIEEFQPKIQHSAQKCIEGRIEFKYKCMKQRDRDTNHDIELLRHVFYSDKFNELLKLFRSLKRQYKKALKAFEEDAITIQEIRDMDPSQNKTESSSSDSSGEPYQPVVKKKTQRTSRKKQVVTKTKKRPWK